MEAVFGDEQHKALRDTVRNRVERYEAAVRRWAEQLQQAEIKRRKAHRLLLEAEKLRTQ